MKNTTTTNKEAKNTFTLVNKLYTDTKHSNVVYRVTAYDTETNDITMKLVKTVKGADVDEIRHIKSTSKLFSNGALVETSEEALTPKKSARVSVACKSQSKNLFTYENALEAIDSAIIASNNENYKFSEEAKKKRICIKYYRGACFENICELWIKTRNGILQYFGIPKIAIENQTHYGADGKVIPTDSWRFSVYHEYKLEADTIKNAVLEIIRKHEEAVKAQA